MPSIIRLDDEKTWPADVIQYLGRHRELFLAWELRRSGNAAKRVNPALYDAAIDGLRAILNPHLLQGYHCTRLTQPEIKQIIANAMDLPNNLMLRDRIDLLQRERLIKPAVAERLKSENQSGDSNRAGMIWFWFYPPRIAGQRGIERFFRSWGGEALYNSHEDNPLTGATLTEIGKPCLVEAHVPIESLAKHSFLDDVVARRFLVNRGLNTHESINHDGRAERPIVPGNIKRVIIYPDPEFVALTACNTWSPLLT